MIFISNVHRSVANTFNPNSRWNASICFIAMCWGSMSQSVLSIKRLLITSCHMNHIHGGIEQQCGVITLFAFYYVSDKSCVVFHSSWMFSNRQQDFWMMIYAYRPLRKWWNSKCFPHMREAICINATALRQLFSSIYRRVSAKKM